MHKVSEYPWISQVDADKAVLEKELENQDKIKPCQMWKSKMHQPSEIY